MRYRPSDLSTTRFIVRRKRTLYRFGRRLRDLETLHVPGVQRNDRASELARVCDLAQGPPPLSDRDHAFRRGDHDEVAPLAQPGGQRDREMRVRAVAVGLGKYS